MDICGLEHLYSDRACVLPADHDSPHQAPDGYRWYRREETYAEGTPDEGVDQWDEPVDEHTDGPQSIRRVALLDEAGEVRTHSSSVPALPRLTSGDAVGFTLRLTDGPKR